MLRTFSLLSLLFFCMQLGAQGETCATAENAPLNDSFNADGPSSGGGCFNCSGTAINADWYTFSTMEEGYATVSSCEDPNGPDTRFWVYSGDCNNLTLIAEGDDGCGIGTNFSSRAEFFVVPGVTYYIEWDDRWESDPFNWRLLFNLCPSILDPIVDYTTIDEAQISWTSSQPANQSQIEYGLAGFPLGTGTIVNSTNASVVISGLTIDTDYQAYITEICPDSTISNLLGPVNFSTDSLPAPDNDMCTGAIPVDCGETVNGSTEFANISLNGEFCGTSIDSPGIWYSIVGDGSLIEASTCDSADFDTKISVFTGTCDSLICVTGIDDSFPCAGNTSIASWQSVPGEQYFILVHGFGGAFGEFNLTMSCITCPTPQLGIVNLTDNSIQIDWDPATPGSTFILEYGLGGFLPGTGTTETGLTGIDGPTYTITGLNPITNYSVYLLQDCGMLDGQSDTSLVLDFTTNDVPPLNDECINAEMISCDTIVSGITTFATVDTSVAPDCGSVTVVAPGVWFTIEGTGGVLTASTCNIADYDTKISVYTGACTDMQCVVANDDAVGPDGMDCSGFSSIATWNSEPGEIYYILVHGYSEFSAGSFNMEITCTEPCTPVPENQACSEAMFVPISPIDSCTYTLGNNSCSSSNLNNPSCDPFGIIQDIWYTFNTGNNTDLTVDLIYTSATNGSFAIYESCDSLEIYCSNNTAGPETLIGLEPNTEYFLQFWNGGSNEAGEIDLCISGEFISALDDLNDSFDELIQVFPNPAFDQVNVKLKDANNVRLHVYDMKGVLIANEMINNKNYSFSIDSWPQGVYHFVFEKDLQRSSQRIIKH
ncbi:MAG: T9SS type A sorting domain-containing protein [Bacteroidota bacterium]